MSDKQSPQLRFGVPGYEREVIGLIRIFQGMFLLVFLATSAAAFLGWAPPDHSWLVNTVPTTDIRLFQHWIFFALVAFYALDLLVVN